jgi:hypothetical protein
MAGRNFSLTLCLSTFVGQQVGSGRHQNASEFALTRLRGRGTLATQHQMRSWPRRSLLCRHQGRRPLIGRA